MRDARLYAAPVFVCLLRLPVAANMQLSNTCLDTLHLNWSKPRYVQTVADAIRALFLEACTYSNPRWPMVQLYLMRPLLLLSMRGDEHSDEIAWTLVAGAAPRNCCGAILGLSRLVRLFFWDDAAGDTRADCVHRDHFRPQQSTHPPHRWTVLLVQSTVHGNEFGEDQLLLVLLTHLPTTEFAGYPDAA